MPRCTAKGKLIQQQGNVTVDTSGGALVINKPWVFSVEGGHWHHCEYVGDTLVMDVAAHTDFPEVDVILRWDPAGPNTATPKIFFPIGTDIEEEAEEGLRRMCGFVTSDVGAYSSATPTPGPEDNEWLAWGCLVGDRQPDGTPIPDVIVVGKDIKGGWVFARPDSSDGGSLGDLPPIRFAIVGAVDGAFFGANRTLYFQSGVDANIRASVRTQFGFIAGAGEDASIDVIIKDGQDLIQIEPKD